MANPLSDPDFLRDPYPRLAALRRTCPVQPVPAGSGKGSSILVTGYAEAREALLDPALSKDTEAFFSGRPSGRSLHPAISQTMLATDPPAHTRLRRMVAGAFSTGTVNALRPYIQQLTEQLVDRFEGPTVDLVRDYTVPLPVTIIGELLGVPPQDRPGLHDLSGQLFAAGQPDVIDVASHTLAEYMDQLVTHKRTAPGEDLLSRLVAARDESGSALTQAELVSLAALLLVAGHETTTHAIGNAVLALLQHPDALARLSEAPERAEAAVDELLRFDSPVALSTFRWSREPTGLGDRPIEARQSVLVALGASNRDPARFADPDTLDLDRDAQQHLAFGHGIHRCVGAPLARAEIGIALRTLLTRHPTIALAVPPEDLAWRQTRLMRGLSSLPVTL